MKELRAFIDGASRGNPGNAGAGIIIESQKGSFQKGIYQYLGKLTNNQAEYSALIILLKELNENIYYSGKVESVVINSDSELLIKQLRGEYKVKSRNLMKYHLQVRKLMEEAKFKIIYRHIPRTENKKADKLANLALDNHLHK